MAFFENGSKNFGKGSMVAIAFVIAAVTSCGDDDDDDGGGTTGGEAGMGAASGDAGDGSGGSATGGRGGSATGGRGGSATGGTSSGGTAGAAGAGDGGQAGGGAGGEGALGGAGGAGGEGGGGTTLPDGMLDPTPYLSQADSPFTDLSFPSYFHLEDWEDDALDTPGVTSPSATLGSSFGEAYIDSVDGDDGVVDGRCSGGCNTLWEGGPVTFTFDAVALGGLPTHVGAVWTDGPGGTSAVFEAFDAADVSLGISMDTGNADSDNSGGVAEDRFLGVVHAAGVKRVVIQSSSGAIEVDHLQYGR
jgi:hypothetical protein